MGETCHNGDDFGAAPDCSRTMNQDQNEFASLKEVLLQDLTASAKSVRMSAILQLGGYLEDAEVLAALEERIRTETDEECRQGYRHLAHLATLRQQSIPPPRPTQLAAPKPAAVVTPDELAKSLL